VRLIEPRIAVIEGKFDGGRITNQKKEKAWQEIVQICENQYGFSPYPPGKDWKHLRDVTWDNWKRDAKKKRDALMATGSEGGDRANYGAVS
jgi:hypothetical protein